MPYIPEGSREEIDIDIEALGDSLENFFPDKLDGALNYTIMRLLVRLYEERYVDMNRALGVLSAVTQEYYRVVVAPYEDKKREENGDVR